jgi:hypothetical protein
MICGGAKELERLLLGAWEEVGTEEGKKSEELGGYEVRVYDLGAGIPV